jgi:hypothetical protein
MADDKQESRIKIDDLPQAQKELTAEEAKEVKGGIIVANTEGDIHVVSKPGDGSVQPQGYNTKGDPVAR